jgi:carbamoyl-phosphate synthase large subunit
MNNYNILLLSAGRRVELVQCFRNASKKLNLKSKIVAVDCQETAPALYFADKGEVVPRISDPHYINAIVELCNRDHIALIVPTIDTELLLLSKNKETIESQTHAKLLVSDFRVVEICRDKTRTQSFLEEHNFLVPKMLSEEELSATEAMSFPLFIKPKDGSSSIQAYKVNNASELELYRKVVRSPIIQEFSEGEEYTVDAFLDFQSNVITIVPRLRLATRSGEISKGKIVKDRAIINEVKRLLEILKPIGPITIQCIKTKRGIEFIEINPRFGGGAPMSITSGADSCENLYRLLMGEQLEYNENYRENLLFLRFDQSICLDENMNIVMKEESWVSKR